MIFGKGIVIKRMFFFIPKVQTFWCGLTHHVMYSQSCMTIHKEVQISISFIINSSFFPFTESFSIVCFQRIL